MLSEFPGYVEGQHAWIVGELALVDSLLTEIVADLEVFLCSVWLL